MNMASQLEAAAQPTVPPILSDAAQAKADAKALSKKWEPAGGWQAVLEAVAVSSMAAAGRRGLHAPVSSAPVSLSSSPQASCCLQGVGLGCAPVASSSTGKVIERRPLGRSQRGMSLRDSLRPSHSIGQGLEGMLAAREALRRRHDYATAGGEKGEPCSTALDPPCAAVKAFSEGVGGGESLSQAAAAESNEDELTGFSEDDEDVEDKGTTGCSHMGSRMRGASDDEDEGHISDAGMDSDIMAQLREYGKDMGEMDLLVDLPSRGTSRAGGCEEIPSVGSGFDPCPDGSSFAAESDSSALSDPANNFFHWLDHGAGKTLDLAGAIAGVSREKLESERIRYLTPEELRDHEARFITDPFTASYINCSSGHRTILTQHVNKQPKGSMRW